MSRLIKVLTMTLVLVTVLLVSVTGAVFAGGEPIDIAVSPNVLNIGSNSSYIHIHTDIGYEGGEVAAVAVDGNEIDPEEITMFADDCGNLVVMFGIDLVKDIVYVDGVIVSDPAVFVLTYLERSGDDSVPVIYPNK